jgi:tetratricopeptide (TPR) repeat protein
VIHRDLKPSNVMLGKFGETLVLDWGLAKVVGRAEEARASGSEETLAPSAADGGPGETAMGSAVGTPAYMSPEQAAGRWDVVAQPSDVYGLGAVLYAVLTGRPPLEGGNWPQQQQKIQRGDFPRPRQVKPAAPRALEAVCLKAMAAEPVGRYPSAQALADDVERWLADEPVSAHADPLPARARRWGRKHPGALAGLAAAVIVGLLGLATGAALLGRVNRQMSRVNRDLDAARQEAVDAAGKEREANERAQARLAQIEKVNDTLNSIFGELDPLAEQKAGKPLREVLGERLDRAALSLDGQAVGDPLVVAKLQHTLGRTQLGLGYPRKAVLLLAKAAATREARLGADEMLTLAAKNALATAYDHAGESRRAVLLQEQTLRVSKLKLGGEHDLTLGIQNNLALAYHHAGQLKKAISLFEPALASLRASLGEAHEDTLNTQHNLAIAYHADGQVDRAISLLEQLLKVKRSRWGDDHPSTLTTLNSLAAAYQDARQVKKALSLFEQALKASKAKLGEDHPRTLVCEHNVAEALRASGRAREAIPLLGQTLKRHQARLGTDHPSTLIVQGSLALA